MHSLGSGPENPTMGCFSVIMFRSSCRPTMGALERPLIFFARALSKARGQEKGRCVVGSLVHVDDFLNGWTTENYVMI